MIERHAGPVATLLHAAHAVMLDHQLLGHAIHKRIEFNHQMTAFAATGAGRKIVEQERHSKSTVRASAASAAKIPGNDLEGVELAGRCSTQLPLADRGALSGGGAFTIAQNPPTCFTAFTKAWKLTGFTT